ncbi:MAG: CaiB/BaiF CoA-transferase family protein [Acidimicrobiia bacterium]
MFLVSAPDRPLEGVRIVAFEAIGPVPLATELMEELGASVTTVARPGGNALPSTLVPSTSARGQVVSCDLKTTKGVRYTMALLTAADVLVEGFRPGTLERLGLGPDTVRAEHPALIYARVTGWGQHGPYATMAGHDINYIGLTGALHAIGPSRMPVPPLNLVGDYGGGTMFAIVGILAALVQRQRTGQGCVVDIAMIDGVGALFEPIRRLRDAGMWLDRRGANLLDGGAPFYRTYATADGKFMAVGALEPAFYTAFVRGLGLDPAELPDRLDPENWIALSERFGEVFMERTRAEWQGVFDGTDACVTPVLSMDETGSHAHNEARATTVEIGSPRRVATAPRFGP